MLAEFLEDDGVPHPGAPGAPSATAGRAGAPARPKAEPKPPAPIDTSAYACVRDLAALDAWIARARALGLVAFDTETDCPVVAERRSLRHLPGAGAGRGLLHPASATARRRAWQLETAAALDQIPLDQVIARLKPLLEDPAVLKVGHNAKYDIARASAATASTSRRSKTPC